MTTHAFTLNGRTSFEVKGNVRPVHDEIRHRLQMLNGKERFSVILWKMPEGIPFDMVDPDSVREYIQCGGSAERMTVEVRTLNQGAPHHEVVGRAGTEIPEGDPSEKVPFGGGYGVRVYPNEVFDADEAGDLLIAYYETGDVPSSYLKRSIAP